MRTGVPAHGRVRNASASLASHLRTSVQERHGSLGALQVTVLDGYPYYVAFDDERHDGEVWFDALTGGMLAGPPERAGD